MTTQPHRQEEELLFYKTWAKDQGIPEQTLKDWIANPNKQFHCIYCGFHGNTKRFTYPIVAEGKLHKVRACPRCKEYKGIEPCIPGHCIFGEGFNLTED